MNYATGYCFNSKELFENFDLKKIKSVNSHYIVNGNKYRRDYRSISAFIYSVKLVLEDVFNNSVTFHLPINGGAKARITMRPLSGNSFKKAIRNGKHQQIDILNADFMTYEPIYIYQVGGVEVIKDIHVNKGLQNIYINKINNGEKYLFNIETKIDNYLKQVKEIFTEFSLVDLKKIIGFGWRALYMANRRGCDTLIKDDVVNKYLFYIGQLTYDSLRHYKYYKHKMTRKLRVLNTRRQIPYDGYYYLGLTKRHVEELKSQFKKNKNKYKFTKIYMHKLFDELKYSKIEYEYVIKIHIGVNLGYQYYKENYETTKFEYVWRRTNNGFESIDRPKQYFNQLFKRNPDNI